MTSPNRTGGESFLKAFARCFQDACKTLQDFLRRLETSHGTELNPLSPFPGHRWRPTASVCKLPQSYAAGTTPRWSCPASARPHGSPGQRTSVQSRRAHRSLGAKLNARMDPPILHLLMSGTKRARGSFAQVRQAYRGLSVIAHIPPDPPWYPRTWKQLNLSESWTSIAFLFCARSEPFWLRPVRHASLMYTFSALQGSLPSFLWPRLLRLCCQGLLLAFLPRL